jgi:N-acetylglutamate synthase-like GNAT family acetyltransferase
MEFVISRVFHEDYRQIKELIQLSARSLQRKDYSKQEIESGLELITGIEELIESGCYFKIDIESEVVAVGGFKLDINLLQAEFKSFFVHPEFARQGMASAILQKCLDECSKYNINEIELIATLTGRTLYQKFGFSDEAYKTIKLSDGSDFKLVKMKKVIS